LTSATVHLGLREAELIDDVVGVRLVDGWRMTLHTLALRDLCPCPDCRHPVSGQRLFESARVIPQTRASTVAVSGEGALLLEWEDGHRSIYSPTYLLEASVPPPAGPTQILWNAGRESSLSWHEWDRVSSEETELSAWLREAAVFGFALLRGVPQAPDIVAEVAETFGAVRETNYGRVFDVRVSVDATNLADTALPLSPHTDNPYRRPTPTLQLLHCLSSEVEGGETVLVDGFAVVEHLRREAPERLAVLATTPIRYAYRDSGAQLTADFPVVALDGDGQPAAIHLNNRSKGVPVGAPEQVQDWYDAYFALLELVDDRAQQIVFRLEPGELVLFDNERILHGRTGFAGGGARHLQGCYADRDGLLSTLAVLVR
jgi:gamma-butyrobetaine dioxygenase